MGKIFERLKNRLKKSRGNLRDKLKKLIKGRNRIDDDLLDEIEQILIESDIGVETSLLLIQALNARVKENRLKNPEDIYRALKEELLKIMGQEKSFFTIPANPKPYVILIVGVNGTGKTTTIGKIASRAMQGGNKVMVAAADTFRAAATEQLEIWAQRAGVPLIKNQPGVDPASVAFDALNSAIAKESDLVLIDTAGRLHTKVNLMEELKKMKRVLGKRMEGAPHEIWLVIDATTGQNGISQAKLFNASLNLTGLILTKLDGTAKGGIAIAIKRELGIPVKMIGIGETLEDLRDFDSEEFINALFADADEEEAE